MKNKINKNGVKRGIVLSVLTLLLVGMLFLNILTPSFATERTVNSEGASIYLDASSVIGNPVRVQSADGYYLAPTAYVYFGSVYNSDSGEYEPILCRVLDANKDNNGNGGAMLLLTENAISLNQRFSNEEDIWIEHWDIENIYTESVMAKFSSQENIFTHTELSLMRDITKTDVASEMEGMFGYSKDYGYAWETDTVVDYAAVQSESAVMLNSSKIFPLSAKELHDYVANYNGAPGMGATHITTKANVDWWLRSGFNDEYGNLVGVVDKNGKVVYKSAVSTDIAGRFAFNIETDKIAFVEEVGNNAYRLAYRSDVESDFTADIFDVNNGTVEIKYQNAPTDIVTNNRTDIYISLMIKDSDGNVKHYECGDAPVRISSGSVSFDLPDSYSDDDSVCVFWEQRGSDRYSLSFVGEQIALDCIHTPLKNATCTKAAICEKCGESYGRPDWDNHENISAELYFDGEKDVHWTLCLDCEERLNISDCHFGNTCISECECGNKSVSRINHSFDDNGICIYDKTHYEPPVQISRGAMSDFEIHNEGQLLFLAEYVNSGLQKNIYGEFWGHTNIVTLKADLDFENIDFIPIGTEEKPFDALTFNGNGHTVKNINYITDGDYAGIFGVADGVYIENLTVRNSNFGAKLGAGVLVGKAGDVDIKNVSVFDSIATATDESGFAGSHIGIASAESSISGGSITYGAYNSSNEFLVFSGNGEASVANSFCVSDITNSEKGEMTLAQFESGEVGYAYASYWRGSGKKAGQEIGVDPYPYMNGPEIFMAITCDGRTVYFNDESERAEIEAHSYNAFAKDPVEFIWQPSGGYKYSCHVHAICEICGKEGLAEASVTERIYSSSSIQNVPRIDFTATITLGDVTLSDSYIIISNNIQEYFGVDKLEKSFDGQTVSPYDLLLNTRLDSDEYTAFFINSETGEKYYELSYDWYGQPYEVPTAVLGVGKYDIHLIGEGAFEGQEYIYKEILVINPITVTVTPKDVYKFYDGTAIFDSDYTTDASEALSNEWLIVKYANSSSASVGEYTLGLSAEISRDTYGYSEYKKAITVVFSRNTVSAFILPANKVVIENKNYPTEFTYGDSIPIPTKEHFKVNFDTALSFEWYSVGEYDYYDEKASSLKKIDGQPKNAGIYLLRAISAPTENMLGASCDVIIEIAKKQLTVLPIVPENVETIVNNDKVYYCIDSASQIEWRVDGLADGDSVESANIIIDLSLRADYPIAECPDRENYYLVYYGYCHDELGISGNYNCESQGIYISLSPMEIPTPIDRKYVHEGKDGEFEVVFSWKAPGVAKEYGEFYEYTVEIYDENGVKIYDVVKGSLYSLASNDYAAVLTRSGRYSAVISWSLRNWYAGTATERAILERYDFTVSITNDSDEAVDSINEMGKYTVSVECNGKTKSAEVIAQRRITMLVKETSINLDSADIQFNKENIVMRAGEVLLLGHTLFDVEFEIDAERGRINVSKIVVHDASGNDVSYLYSLNNYDSSGEYNILHVYDSACDTDCNSEYCNTTRVAAHIGGSANCTSLAVCENCGMLYGDYDYTKHTSNGTTVVVNPEDHMTHLELANCCGKVIRTSAHVAKENATCTTIALCLHCDWRYGELDPDNHSSSVLEYSQIADNAQEHSKKHICCGKVELESHVGGVATCANLAKCEKCQAPYGVLDESNHESAPVCVVDKDDATKHRIAYNCCGASWIEEHSGGKATCTDKAVCELCKTQYGEIDPQSHASDKLEYLVREDNVSMHDVFRSCCHLYIGKAYHSGGTATCAAPALCEHCGTAYGDIDSAVHSSNEFTYIADGEFHIKAHACCSVEISREAHRLDGATCTHGTLCVDCGYEQGERAEHIYDNDCDYICNVCNEVTRAAGFHTDENGDSLCDICDAELEAKKLSGGAISGIAVGSVAIAGIGGFSLAWFVIKKKSLAELLRLLLG